MSVLGWVGRSSVLLSIILPISATPSAAEDKPMGYVIYASQSTGILSVYYDNRYYKCEMRKRCERLVEGVPFYTALDFKHSRELVDYIGNDHTINDCILHNCELIQ